MQRPCARENRRRGIRTSGACRRWRSAVAQRRPRHRVRRASPLSGCVHAAAGTAWLFAVFAQARDVSADPATSRCAARGTGLGGAELPRDAGSDPRARADAARRLELSFGDRARDRMRILIYSRAFLPQIGGLELNVAQIAEEFVRLGHEVVVITTTPGKEDATIPYPVLRNPGPLAFLRSMCWCDVFHHPNV